jgi:magnesium transporter
MSDTMHPDSTGSAPGGHSVRSRLPRVERTSQQQRADVGSGSGKETSKHQDTAGRYVVAGVPRANSDRTVDQVISDLLSRQYDCLDIVCVLDDDERLVGIIPLAGLLSLPRETRIGSVVEANFPKVHATADQERVASLALHHALSAIPVIDVKDRLLGVVPSEALLQILRREHVEDIHRFAGISRETDRAREAIESPPLRRLRHRLPWLLLGLVGSVLATFIMTRFEGSLSSSPAIAFFVPGLVYLADAIGTQTEAVAVRGLSLSHARLASLVGGELRTGILIGLVLGSLTFPVVWLAFGDLNLALAVATALIVAGGIATTIGLFLPWLLGRLGSDPAYGSGPLATIIQDLLSLLTYFVVVSAVMA